MLRSIDHVVSTWLGETTKASRGIATSTIYCNVVWYREGMCVISTVPHPSNMERLAVGPVYSVLCTLKTLEHMIE